MLSTARWPRSSWSLRRRDVSLRRPPSAGNRPINASSIFSLPSRPFCLPNGAAAQPLPAAGGGAKPRSTAQWDRLQPPRCTDCLAPARSAADGGGLGIEPLDRVGGSLAAPTSHTTVRAVRHTAVHGRRCKRGARSWRGVLRGRRGRLTRPHRTLAGSARYPPGGLRHRSRPVGVSIGRRGVGPCRSSRFGPSPPCAAATMASADFWPPFAAPHGATSRNGGRPDLPG